MSISSVIKPVALMLSGSFRSFQNAFILPFVSWQVYLSSDSVTAVAYTIALGQLVILLTSSLTKRLVRPEHAALIVVAFDLFRFLVLLVYSFLPVALQFLALPVVFCLNTGFYVPISVSMKVLSKTDVLDKHLHLFNVLLGNLRIAAMLIGGLSAGLIIAHLGALGQSVTVSLIGLLPLLCSVLYNCLSRSTRSAAGEATQPEEAPGKFRLAKLKPHLKLLLVWVLIADSFIILFDAYFPVFADQVFAGDTRLFGVADFFVGIGGIIGGHVGWLFIRYLDRQALGMMVVAFLAVFFALKFVILPIPFIVAVTLIGLAYEVSVILLSQIQKETPRQHQAAMHSTFYTINSLMVITLVLLNQIAGVSASALIVFGIVLVLGSMTFLRLRDAEFERATR